MAFGVRLRSLRSAKGISLSEFARRLYYAKGYVSRIETGMQLPSAAFARRCDAELGTGGELAAMVPVTTPESTFPVDSEHDDDGVWVMTMGPDGAVSFTSIGRRDVIIGGVAVLAGLGITMRPARPSGLAGDQLDQHGRVLAAARELGQVAPPATVLPMLVSQIHALRMLARDVRGQDAVDVTTLMLRTAEFASWMAQEAGDGDVARWWINRAVQIADEVGDQQAAAYALVRQALITLYQGDPATTVALARKAQSASNIQPRILSLAAQREAQGHAYAGDHDACLRALDTAARHAAAADQERTDGPVIGTAHVPDPVAAVRGWCLYDLGRPGAAAEVLDEEVARIPVTAVRARLRFGVRQALAHAEAGDIEGSCALAQDMLFQVRAVDSATVRADVRRLATTLRRWHKRPAVRALDPVFSATLYRGA